MIFPSKAFHFGTPTSLKIVWTGCLLLGLSFSHVSASLEGDFGKLERLIEQSPQDSLPYYLALQAEKCITNHERLENLMHWATYYRRSGQADSALLSCERALPLAENPRDQAQVTRNHGLVLMRMAEWEKAKLKLLEAASLFPEKKDQGACYHSLATLSRKTGNPDSAYHYLTLAKHACTDPLVPRNLATILNSIGIHHYQQAHYDSAALYYQWSIYLYQQEDMKTDIGRTYGLLGALYYYQEQFEEAEDAFRLEQLYFPQTFRPQQQLANLIGMGAVFDATHRSDSAIVYFQKARAIAAAHKLVFHESAAVNNLAVLFMHKDGEGEKAMELFKASWSLASSVEDRETMAIAQSNIGLLFLRKNQLDSALAMLNSAYQLAESVDYPEGILEASQGLVAVHEANGEADSAFHYLKVHTEWKDSIASIEMAEKLEKIKGDYDLQIASLRNVQLQSDLKESAQALHIKRIETWFYIGLATLLAFALAAVLYFLGQRSRMKQQTLDLAEVKLARETAEKDLIMAKLNQSKSVILEKNRIIDKLETLTASEEVRENLVLTLATDQDWANFIMEFDFLYPQVFARLEKLPVKLSKNDYRYAAMIKLKLTNKEMASILNITLGGVKAAKNRLRNKIKPLVPEAL